MSDLSSRANAVGVLIRSGFTPEASLAAAQLPPVAHTGLLPVTLQSEAKATAGPGQQGAVPHADGIRAPNE